MIEKTFGGEGSGYYFILPKGLQLTNIIDSQSREDIFNKFPKDVNDEANSGGQPYRFFSREKMLIMMSVVLKVSGVGLLDV